METRISMMEKENTELRELRLERERLSREIDVANQRLNTMQRLHTQQVSHSTSSLNYRSSNPEIIYVA